MLPLPKLFCCGVPWGSIRPTLTSCSGWPKGNPRRTKALTMVNWVVTPAIPSARTNTARKQNDFSLKRMRKPTRTSWRKVSRIIMGSWVGVGDKEGRFEDEMREEGEMDSKKANDPPPTDGSR